MQKLSEKQKKERKFLLVLPILTLPFLCLGFWALGGGTGISTGLKTQQQEGLNMSLPEAQLESQALNKLESYEQAEKQASRIQEQRRMDPFSNHSTEKQDTLLPFSADLGRGSSLHQTEDQVQIKLGELEKLLSQPDIEQEPVGKQRASVGIRELPQANVLDDPDMQRLEALMESVIEPEMEDPEMDRIDAMLDKLLDVQHPQRVHDRMSLENQGEREAVYSVSLDQNSPQPMGVEETGHPEREQNGFYSLGSDELQSFAAIRPSISAQVIKDQEVVTGASIDLELTQSVFIDGMEFLEGTPLTGVCTLDGERLNIAVRHIRSGNRIIPVSMEAMDLDALPGLRIPNAITRDAVKQGAGDGVQSMNMMGMSSSWEAQASMAGMETVKGILSKKAKLVKVTVKAGHPLLLVDNSGN